MNCNIWVFFLFFPFITLFLPNNPWQLICHILRVISNLFPEWMVCVYCVCMCVCVCVCVCVCEIKYLTDIFVYESILKDSVFCQPFSFYFIRFFHFKNGWVWSEKLRIIHHWYIIRIQIYALNILFFHTKRTPTQTHTYPPSHIGRKINGQSNLVAYRFSWIIWTERSNKGEDIQFIYFLKTTLKVSVVLSKKWHIITLKVSWNRIFAKFHVKLMYKISLMNCSFFDM